ncbi:MAG: transcriptional regulator, MerR family [Rhodocyclales bacterium]|nr:transcriptional regulator, MerR family [Rhodocyclales bacterium]
MPEHSELPPTLGLREISSLSGVAVSTLRFYERKRLIKGSTPPTSAARQYARDVLRRVTFIRMAQRAGISLAEVEAALATLPEDTVPSHEDWERVCSTWRAGLDERIVQLQQLRDTLDDCIDCDCPSIEPCQLHGPSDKPSAKGSDPH